MTAKVDTARNDAHASADIVDQAVYDARVGQQKELESQIQKTLGDKTNVERALKDLSATHRQLKDEATKEKKARNRADRALPHSINLFKEVSGVTWDYLAQDVRGVHCKPGDASMKTPFVITDCHSQKESIDRLWEMIGTC
eukprot:TRINITY_DN39417_c0_g1_i1.p1 TRINITY_DN39417_c0_g1~~TRINITY_DN39417_c0_g1_i1.p1  ORF type:complete len:141 (-),score=21.40 TRINITY_DN39417_c0_g1_i1:279-701(-)